MILVGNQRGGARELAQHLLKEENERVIVHEIRGFVSDDLHGAFLESYGVSRGTRCKQHLYSLSLNPPHEADPTPKLFEKAINEAEERLGLKGQPRAIVFHEKIGSDGQLRRHAHAVWCRIDIETMKAVQMSYDRRKLNDLGRELYLEHGWTMPRGFVRHEERDPRNYSLAEWQQAKRAKKDPARLKAMFQDCWAISDTQAAFAHALKERGYILARGDRRGVVAVDYRGEVYGIAKWVGIKTRQVASKVADTQNLPDVTAAQNEAAKRIADRLNELRATQAQVAKARLKDIAERRRRAIRAQNEAIKRCVAEQKARTQIEEAARNSRVRTGWRGLLDRITGTRKRIMAENLEAAKLALRRELAEHAALAEFQKTARQELMNKARSIKVEHKAMQRELSEDVAKLGQVSPSPDHAREKETLKYVRKQKREAERPRRRRSRSHGGPTPTL